ncbi:pyocin S6 family toxin immunity protein, partial [Pseudomonas sp.]
MHLCISGFLIDDSEDDSLKFELDVSKDREDAVMEIMNWRNFN